MNGNNLRTSNLVEYNVSGGNTKDDELSYQFVLEVTDSESDNDSRESVFSIQAETTVSAKDSSDISTGEESDNGCSEYELASSSDECLHPWSFDRNISSESSPHQADVDTASIACLTSGEKSCSNDGAECLESELDTDSDLSVVNCRFKYCAMCSSVNANPSFRFCHSCYQIKKTFFPEKPAAKRKRKRTTDGNGVGERRETKRPKLRTADEEKIDLSSSPEAGSGTSGGGDGGSGACGGGDSGFESLNSQHSNDSPPDDGDVDGDVGVGGASSSSTSLSGFGGGGGGDADPNADGKCLTCFHNATNAIFLHGKTGHLCCCYGCAKRIWFGSGRCPICRSKVSNVIRILKA